MGYYRCFYEHEETGTRVYIGIFWGCTQAEAWRKAAEQYGCDEADVVSTWLGLEAAQ